MLGGEIMLVNYLLTGAVIAVMFAVMFVILPQIQNNKNLLKFKTLISIACDIVRAIEQEYKEAKLDPNDPDYAEKKEEFNTIKKQACKEAIEDVLVQYNLPIPDEAVLNRAIEAGVYALNEGKKLLGK
jgi:hypothetical protein